VDEEIKMRDMYTILATEKNEILTVATRRELEDAVVSEII
jgi:hypothetical protein